VIAKAMSLKASESIRRNGRGICAFIKGQGSVRHDRGALQGQQLFPRLPKRKSGSWCLLGMDFFSAFGHDILCHRFGSL